MLVFPTRMCHSEKAWNVPGALEVSVESLLNYPGAESGEGIDRALLYVDYF